MEGKTQEAAAEGAGMSVRCARHWQAGPYPSQAHKPHRWRTRPDPLPGMFDSDIAPLLAADERRLLEARTLLGEQAFNSAWVEGRTMTPEQAASGLHQASLSKLVSAVKQPPSLTSPNQLTAREMDVLRLLAQGLTSAQIADRLVIGVVTVNFHVRSIYSKLGVSSRSAATRYAIEHKLV